MSAAGSDVCLYSFNARYFAFDVNSAHRRIAVRDFGPLVSEPLYFHADEVKCLSDV